MCRFLCLWVVFFGVGLTAAQVSFTAAPKTKQLYARSRANDTARVTVSGSVNSAGVAYTQIRVKAYRNGVLQATLPQTLNFTGATAPFSIAYGIKAELANYKFEVVGFDGSVETVVRTADSVVAGDVFIIQGQSNAEAHSFSGTTTAIQSSFIRVMGTSNSSTTLDSLWYIGQGDGDQATKGNTGQWGLRMARSILDSLKIPVAVFNGCWSGQPISNFQRTDATPTLNSTNYGRLLLRLKNARLDSAVRAIFWVQGENDMNTTMANYKSRFQALYADWLADYPNTEKVYIFQVRNGCQNTVNQMAPIMEAHRQLAAELPKAGIMAMSGQTHETAKTCHYPYVNGYEMMGNNIFRLLARDLYGAAPVDNMDAPTIQFAEVSGTREVTLVMKNVLDSIRWYVGTQTTTQSQFRLAGTAATVTAGATQGNKVRLVLSADAGAISNVSFMGDTTIVPDPMVLNLNNIGAVHFYQFPVTLPRYRDSVSAAAILSANGASVIVDSLATYGANGRITALNLGARGLTRLPADVGYLDSLVTLNLSGNALTSVPRELLTLPAVTVDVSQNRLCGLPAATITWLDAHAAAGWKASQTRDGTTACTVTGISGPATLRAALLRYSLEGRRLYLFFGHPAEVLRFRLVRADGHVMTEVRRISGPQVLDVSAYGRGTYFLQVQGRSENLVKKLILL